MDRGNIAGSLFEDEEFDQANPTNVTDHEPPERYPLDDFESLLASANQTHTSPALRERILNRLENHFEDKLSQRATHLLHENQPLMSAISPLARWQRNALIFLPLFLTTGVAIFPKVTASAILFFIFIYCFASTFLKGALMFVSLKRPNTTTTYPQHKIPVVSIFLPVRNEDRAIIVLVSELKKLNYPTEKLDIKFLVEAEDTQTLKALSDIDLPTQFSVLKIPKSLPQTKPKAMNYALPFAQGEIIGIYDAEDAPEPDQIRKAVAALDAAGDQTVCVQSRLNHYEATETFISRMASLEYTLWFDMLLRGLSNLRLPVPLGGTSLFIETHALKAIDGWDPNNVTEDADLGVRLARQGWRAEVIESTTWEEPPIGFAQWTGQRSRWIKGFMVTWLVHMREPRKLFRELGWTRALAINVMLLDGFVAFLLQPFFLLAIGWAIIIGGAPWSNLLASPLSTAIMWLFLLGQAFIITTAFIAVTRRFGPVRALWTPALWLYWQGATIPAYRALREMFGQQTMWRKTAHGLSKAAKQRRDKALQETQVRETTCVTARAPSETRHVRTDRTAKNWNGQPRLSQSTR